MSDSENRASPEVQEPVPDQPEAEEVPAAEADPPKQEESAEPEADQPEPAEAKEPEPEPEPQPSSEDKPAEAEPEGDKEAEEGDKKPEEGDKKPEEEAAAPGEEKKEEKVQEEEEEPVVITPEGNPLWLSTEEVLSKGLPESEVENFKNFYFKHAHSLQSFHDALKDVMVQTEFVTLSKEEIDALTVEGDVSEEQQQVLNGLQDRINAVIELYETDGAKDGAMIKINGRSAKDAVLEKNNETFVQTIQDAVINSLEIEKQSCSAYSVWKDQEHHPGAFKRGINKIRASFRSRSRAGSAGGRRRPKLEEEKGDDAPKDEEGKGEEPKPAKEGEAASKEEGEAEAVTVQVEVEVETGGDKPEEAAAKDEEPKEEATAEPAAAEEPPKDEPKEEAAPEPASEEAPKEEDGDKKEDGEIQAAEGDKEEDKKEGKSPKRKSVHKKQKTPEEHQCKEAKTEPLDNRILRAFGRVVGSYYRAEDGKAAVDQLRSSIQIRNDLNKLKAFGGVEGVQVSLSVCRWLAQIPEQTGMQFRGFVYDNELTALSQYNDNVYFPNVVHYKDTVISGKVQQFFQDSIKEPLKDLKNYLIDFFVAPDKVYVLRLSPFYTAMGACLFTWNEDGRVLTKGPFQIRVVNAPKSSPDAYSSFQPWWQEMLTSVLQQRKESESRPAPSGRMGCVIL